MKVLIALKKKNSIQQEMECERNDESYRLISRSVEADFGFKSALPCTRVHVDFVLSEACKRYEEKKEDKRNKNGKDKF